MREKHGTCIPVPQQVQLRPEESFPQFAARQWARYWFELLDPVRHAAGMFAWRHGCIRCVLKGNGLLCARHFGELRKDVKRIVEYLAAAGRS